MQASEVLSFWFGQDRKRWFEKNPALDEEIRSRFLPLFEQGLSGGLEGWKSDPRACLALVLLFDQFPRNMFRGTARAFAGDELARACATTIVEKAWDKAMTPDERLFAYLPLEHSESLADQERCLALMREIAVYPETADMPKWAEAHLAIIRRFGRFPHRNTALGRESTAEEIEFLSQPGSSF
ncbi:MAG: hypothetical protein A3G83_04505 [Betaproteobacteria bacterium RIFCSPLOWO2_12_FULL_68_20]|nr:MAG: hypothetical protein A3G83_04505 [Betaproteobacteria bacterium RIFCSPLOWO2_12_FULL_68_20]